VTHIHSAAADLAAWRFCPGHRHRSRGHQSRDLDLDRLRLRRLRFRQVNVKDVFLANSTHASEMPGASGARALAEREKRRPRSEPRFALGATAHLLRGVVMTARRVWDSTARRISDFQLGATPACALLGRRWSL
jgi:hypothetical protein